MANLKTWVSGLGLALIIAAAACENASDALPAAQPSNLVITQAQPADGDATLTGIGGSYASVGSGRKFVHLSQVVNGITHRVEVEYAISTDEIVSAVHDWGPGFYGTTYYQNSANCEGAGCLGQIAVDSNARTMTITGVSLASGTTTSTLNGTLSWH